MKVFLSYATNLEEQLFSFCFPVSAILPSAICTYDDHFHTGKLQLGVDGVSENSRTYNAMLGPFAKDARTYYFMRMLIHIRQS